MGCNPVCDCNLTMGNTGTDCTPLINVTKKINFIPVYDSVGNRNSIDLTGTIDAALFTALINQADVSKRLFPLPELKNINDKRNDPITQKFADDSTIFIRDGIRNFDGLIVGKNASPVLKAKIEAGRCGEMGVYLTDRLGNFIGIVSDDKTKLYPIRLDSESIAAAFEQATDTTIQALKVMFQFHADEQDACIGMITATELTTAKPLLFKGLLDVYGTFTALATTGATVKLYTLFGSAITPTVVKGLLTADFVSAVTGVASKVRNNTSAADITLTSATESTTVPGTYVLIWTPAQTTGNKIAITCKKNGFDFTNVAAAPVTVP